jgi:predicted Zn-dependent protease
MEIKTMGAIFLAGLMAAGLVSCATVPGTGRSQLILVSPGEEMQLGITEFDKLKKSTPISHDAAVNALVQRVGRRIAAVAEMPNAQWEFVVFDQPKTANAFCLPGGKVGIYTGILPITKNEAGLATVIGHEVAHAVARHGAERLSEGLLIQLGGVVLSEAMQKNSSQARGLALGAYGVTSTLGVALPHSRSQELEADHLGLLYMARAGYDPQEAVEFWKRFEAFTRQQGGGTVEFLSTHPVDSTRIKQLESLLPEAEREYQRATSRY